MDRKNFFYRQVVLETELDAGFTDVETSFKNLAVDHGLTGILTGFVPSSPLTAPYQVTLASGVAYSKTLGRRMNYAGGVVSLATDENSNPVSLPSVDGQMRVVSIFIEPVYTESDPRTDGNGNPVNFVKTEAVQLRVVAGTFGTVDNAPAPSYPALRSDQVLLADIVTYYDAIDGLGIFAVTSTPVTAFTNNFGDFTVSARSEYMLSGFPEDYSGSGFQLAGKLGTAISTLTQKNKKYQTDTTVSSADTSDPKNLADVNAPTSHNAFAGGVFAAKTGSYKLKLIDGISTYIPTQNVQIPINSEVSGASRGRSPHVFDLNTNSVNLDLVINNFKLKNLTLYAPFTNYRVVDQPGSNAAKFENILFNPVNNPSITHDKLFFNVQNFSATRYRKNYSLEVKDSSSNLGNFIFGSRKDSTVGVPRTVVENFDTGNLTIDTQGGRYNDLRVECTDTTVPGLLISGDNNIIETVVISCPLGNAPALFISGRNNTIRNVFIHNFGSHAASISSTRPSFKAVAFSSGSTNNIVETIHIQGGTNTFSGTETDLNGAAWTRTNITAVDDLLADVAHQQFADRVTFSTNPSSYLSRADSAGETEAVFEIWARSESGTKLFRMNSATGTSTADFIVETEWKRFRNIATGVNSETRIRNGSDNAARNILFANPARYNLANLGSITLVDIAGEGNTITGLLIENLKNLLSPLIYFRSGNNKLENTLIDGVYSISNPFVRSAGSSFAVANIDGLTARNLHTSSMFEYLLEMEYDTALRAKNINLDMKDAANRCTSMDCGIASVTGGNDSRSSSSLEDCRFVDNRPVTGSKFPLVLGTLGLGKAPISLKNVYSETQYGNGVDLNAGGAAFVAILVERLSIENCEFYAERGRSTLIMGCSGSIQSAIFSGGDTDPGAGIQLFSRVTSGLYGEPPLEMKSCTMRYGESNRNSGVSAGIPLVSMGAEALFVDGLKIYSENTGSTSERILDVTHAIFDSTGEKAGSLANVDVQFFGSFASGTAVKVVSTTPNRSLSIKNLNITGYQVGATVLANTLVDLQGVDVDGLTIDGHATQGAGTILRALLLNSASVKNLKMFKAAEIPTSSALVVMTDSSLKTFDINYNLTTDPVDYIIDMNIGENYLEHGRVLTQHAAIDITGIRTFATINISPVIEKVYMRYQTAFTGAITKPMLTITGAGTYKAMWNHFVYNTNQVTSPVSVTNGGFFFGNTLENLDGGFLASLTYTSPGNNILA